MKVFRADASPKKTRSNSRALADYFIERLTAAGPVEVDALDLASDPPPHPSEIYVRAIYTPPGERTIEMTQSLVDSDALCGRLLAADALVFSMPMHNWTMPSAFKAFIDQIVRYGVTFVPGENGQAVGQLGRQKVLFVTSRGGDGRPGTPYAALDALTPALKAAFGFIGVKTPTFVDAQPMQFADPEARAAAWERAKLELDAVAAAWAAPRAAPLTEGASDVTAPGL